MAKATQASDSTEALPEEQQVALKTWVILARAFNAISARAADDVRLDGLSLGEFAVLELLYSTGPALLGEIQKRVLVSSGGITFLVDRLVKKGMVERRDCPGDRRARYAALTSAGDRLMKRVFPRHARRVADSMGGLSTAQQRELARLLKQLGVAAAQGESV